MKFTVCSYNGKIIPLDKAVININNIEYAYGFGVYETIRVQNDVAYFIDDHIERLLTSAQMITLDHLYTKKHVAVWIQQLIHALQDCAIPTYNLKIVLIGAADPNKTKLYIIPSLPFFPDRKLFHTGATAITVEFVRSFPHAKTLNMLNSYLAYRTAKQHGCYDALAVSPDGYITEGTRTNFFGITDKTIFSPPKTDILLGVTRKYVLEIAQKNGYEIIEKTIAVNELPSFDGAFLTSTSSKIMPLIQINKHRYSHIPPALQELQQLYSDFLDAYHRSHQ